MNLSNFQNLYIRRENDNKPNRIMFYCDIDNDTYIVHIEKWEGVWGIHYVSHWIEFCKHCDVKVRLDTNCKPITACLRDNFDELMKWLGEQKRLNPEAFM